MRLAPPLARLALAALLLALGGAFAAAEAQSVAGMIQAIPDTFEQRVRPFMEPVRATAISLFAFISAIGVCFALYEQINGGGGLADILRAILRQGIMIGFWYWLLINGGFFHDIINAFAMAANNASTAGGGTRNFSPGDMAGVGINIVNLLWANTSVRSPFTSAILLLAGVGVLIAFIYITFRMVEVVVESFIFAVMAILVLAFGGSVFTREMAIAGLRLAVSIGLKRFVLQLLVGVGEALMRGWAQDFAQQPANVGAVVSIGFSAGMMFLLAMTLPQRAGNVLMGAHTGGYGAGLMGTMKAAMGTAMKAATAAAGTSAAAGAAYSLASAQLGQRAPSSNILGRAAGGMGRAAQLTYHAAGNAGRAAAADVGRRLTGHYGAQHGSMPWRMADDMKRRTIGARAGRQNNGP